MPIIFLLFLCYYAGVVASGPLSDLDAEVGAWCSRTSSVGGFLKRFRCVFGGDLGGNGRSIHGSWEGSRKGCRVVWGLLVGKRGCSGNRTAHALLSFCHRALLAILQKLESRAVRHVRVACWYWASCWPCLSRNHTGVRMSVRQHLMHLKLQTPNAELLLILGRIHGSAKSAMSSNRGCSCCIVARRGRGGVLGPR